MAAFVEVAERGSFNAAARRLSRSPTAVTRAVAELEARLGVRLLNRTTRAVSLTEVGQRFLNGARGVLADVAEIESAAAGQGRAPRGELVVTTPILFGRLHVLPIVTALLGQYPDLSVRMMLLDRPVDLVEEGIDVAVRIGALTDSSAVATRVGALRRVVVASPDYLARRGTPQTPRDLSVHDAVTFAGMSGLARWHFDEAGKEFVASVQPRLSVTTAEAAIDAVITGLGVTRVLSYQAVDALGKGMLTRILTSHEGAASPVHVLYPGGRHPPPKLRAFVDFAVPRLRHRLDEIESALGA